MVDKDLNYMLSSEPLGNNKEGALLKNVFNFVKTHSKHWGFYFV